MRSRPALAALAVYLGLSVTFFGVAVLPRPAHTFIGSIVGIPAALAVAYIAYRFGWG